MKYVSAIEKLDRDKKKKKIRKVNPTVGVKG